MRRRSRSEWDPSESTSLPSWTRSHRGLPSRFHWSYRLLIFCRKSRECNKEMTKWNISHSFLISWHPDRPGWRGSYHLWKMWLNYRWDRCPNQIRFQWVIETTYWRAIKNYPSQYDICYQILSGDSLESGQQLRQGTTVTESISLSHQFSQLCRKHTLRMWLVDRLAQLEEHLFNRK